MASTLTIEELKERLSDPDRISAEAFDILKALGAYAGRTNDEPKVQELVLRALEHRNSFGGALPVLDGLVRQLGLFPYLELDELGLADSIAYEFHRPFHMAEDNVVFHRVQAEVYRKLIDGENVILSAPTSFGKSLLIDAIVASKRYNNIAIVVPTIALIDETRKRLSRFSETFKIITHTTQLRSKRNLFIMTQERILDLDQLEPLDLFVIDEFYKLKPRDEDRDRSFLLNEAFYRLQKTDAQYYLLGPNIKGVDANLAEKQGVYFLVTDYKTVVSEVHRVKPAPGEELSRLVKLCAQIKGPTLIYCSSPARVRKVVEALIEGSVGHDRPGMKSAVEWIGKEYSPKWLLPRALQRGIGMHHGRLPRTLAQYAVRAFNEGLVQFLVCTSTLIEGVNTKAKNIIIFDNKIARRKFDLFTFNNIRGRSGRMFEHFIGHVYVFHEPPAEELPFVDVPVLTQPADMPESLLIQIDESDLIGVPKERLSRISSQKEIDLAIVKQSHGIDPHSQIDLARALRLDTSRYWAALNWKSWPTGNQLYSVSQLIWDFFVRDSRRRAGVNSGKQLAFTIDRFRRMGSAPALLRDQLSRTNGSPDETVEDVMDWLRLWANFWFPRYLMAVDRVQKWVFLKAGLEPGDFVFFAGRIENWFLDPTIMALDEYGVPIQVGEKLTDWLQPEGDLDAVLERLKSLPVEKTDLSLFERSLVEEARRHL